MAPLLLQVRDAKRVFVFTGAGISTACGIPDFRCVCVNTRARVCEYEWTRAWAWADTCACACAAAYAPRPPAACGIAPVARGGSHPWDGGGGGR